MTKAEAAKLIDNLVSQLKLSRADHATVAHALLVLQTDEPKPEVAE